MSLATKFVSFDRLKRYTQHVKSYVGQQILNAKGEWAKQLNLKVDKVEGKGLSTNDFTTELKNKLNGIEAGAQVNTVTGIKGNAESAYRQGDVNLTPADIGAVASSNGDASNTKVTFTQSTSRVNLTSGDTLKTAFGKLSKWFVDLKAVAFSGSYNDLSNKPTTLKNPKSLTIRQNGGNQTEYDGSTALTVNITKAGIGLGNVENKSSETIRSELTSSDVTTALGYTPINSSATNLTNQSLDAYKGTDYMGKMYYSGGSNSVTGKPSGVDNFWMWVTRTGSGVFSQILMDNKCQLYIRYHDANSWSTWKQVISSGNNVSLLNNDKDYQTLQQVEDKINEIVSSAGDILKSLDAAHINSALGYMPGCSMKMSLWVDASGTYTSESSVHFGRNVAYSYERACASYPIPSWPEDKGKDWFSIVSFYPQDSSISMDEFNKIVSIEISSVDNMKNGVIDFTVYFEKKPTTSFYVTLNVTYSDVLLGGSSMETPNLFAFMGVDTSDATATAEDIIKDITAYVDGEKITGTMVDHDAATNAVSLGTDGT